LGEIEEPGSTGREARGRRRLGQKDMAMIEAGQDVLFSIAHGVVVGRIFKANATDEHGRGLLNDYHCNLPGSSKIGRMCSSHEPPVAPIVDGSGSVIYFDAASATNGVHGQDIAALDTGTY
jgi:hypothetical protein